MPSCPSRCVCLCHTLVFGAVAVVMAVDSATDIVIAVDVGTDIAIDAESAVQYFIAGMFQ